MKSKDNRPKMQAILNFLLVDGNCPDSTQAISYAREVLADIDAELAKVTLKVAARKRAALHGGRK